MIEQPPFRNTELRRSLGWSEQSVTPNFCVMVRPTSLGHRIK
jgi:hypothetical protein